MATLDTATAGSSVDALASEAKFFSEQMDWPVTIDVLNERLVVATGQALDGLRIPRTVAEQVAAELSTSLMAGPVSRDGSDRWWTFITGVSQRSDKELPHELRLARVYAVPFGGELVVPPVTKLASWWQPPRPDRALPPYATVIAVARKVIARGS